MQNFTDLRPFKHIAPLCAGALLVASGCGSTTTMSSPAEATDTVAEATTGFDIDPPRMSSTTAPTTVASPPSTTSATNTPITLPAPTPTPASTTPPTTTAPPVTTPPAPPAPPVTAPPVTAPPITAPPAPPVTAPPAPPPPPPCGVFGPVPADATVTSELTVALDADGLVDDQVITYTDSIDILRTVRNGVISEFGVPDVGVSHIRALGVGNAGEISAGNEVIVKTRSGASGAVIGVFGHDTSGCLFEFTRNGDPLEMYVGATIGNSSGAYCGDGIIAEWGYSLDSDGTYFGASAAFFESTAGDFTYLPSSDDFSEGLTIDELSPASLDCFGFGL